MKEQIKVADMAKNSKYPDEKKLHPDDWENYVVVHETKINYDREKGFVDYECVVLREADGKYFKFFYTQFGHNGNDLLEQTAVEVVQKEKIVYYYE